MTAKNASRAKGRTSAARCATPGCRGSARPGHASTATHRAAVARIRVETSGPADEKRVYHIPSREREDAYHQEQAEIERLDDWLAYCAANQPEYPDGVALITLKEAARRVERSEITLRSAIRRGKMVAHKYGRDWLVEESEVRYYELTSLGRVGWPKGRPRRKPAA